MGCKVDGCLRPVRGNRTHCAMHQKRFAKYGKDFSARPNGTVEERYWACVKINENGCRIWTGSDVSDEGYARFRVNGKRVGVHRWAFERWVRPLKPGEVVDHLCNTPLCSNPEHLRACTHQRENVLRSLTGTTALNARKTHCDHGHPFDEENTKWTTQNGWPLRICKECKRQRQRAYMARKAAKAASH